MTMTTLPFRLTWLQRIALVSALLTLLSAAAQAAPGCEEPPLVASSAAPAVAPDEAKAELASLAREAVAQSADVRSAQHSGRAARFDLVQTAAAAKLGVGLSGALGVNRNMIEGDPRRESRSDNLALSVSAPLYDGGRLDELIRYRQRLVDAGEEGIGAVRERVVRDAVTTALERNRYTVQLAVHERYVAKMACLVRMMEQVVELDRGRSSELIQARKGLRQAQLAREDALTARRQAETRLQQLVGGPALLPWSAAGVPLQELPALDQVVSEITVSPDVRQLRLQAEAMEFYAQASRAETSPQVRWQVGASQSRYAHVDSANWNAGLTLNLVLADGGAATAGSNAASERALAARRQEDAVVEERVRLAAMLHDAATSARTRAQQVVEVLKESEQVRAATYEQWSRLGRRSLFDLMSAESEHVQLRLAEVNAQHDAWSAIAQLRSAGAGLLPWLAPDLVAVVRR